MDKLLAPWERDLGAGLSGQNSSWFTEVALFIEVLMEAAPESLQRILAMVDVAKAEQGWTDSLEKAGDARHGVARLVEAAISRTDAVGDMARRLRKRFPKASVLQVPKPKRSGKRSSTA
ncbi:hypothetical protein H8A97_00035 [Bradyrhizobium sp. Arg62]|uniref:hypothetical protein n=1 Tax=Bradyrhizobium brasilense TaxID=1419277 RepID=UPI001E36262A|nr:hypothetical protein [Bradyrhizobium brasilense]MCC8943530.1 hypothetical protein [Bradyrhizobium brasilense]